MTENLETPTSFYQPCQVIIDAGLVPSKSIVRRLAAQGAISLNGHPLDMSEIEMDFPCNEGDSITVGKSKTIKVDGIYK